MTGRILSQQEAADEGLDDGPAVLSDAEAAAEGLNDHAQSQVAPESLTEPGGLSHGPGTSFALNALDSLSVVGLPTTLGLKDALMGDAKDGDFRTRYRKAKQFYEGGMDRLHDTNPKSATAGQVAPMAIPGGAMMKGAKLAQLAKMGATMGAAGGAFRGPSDTMGGDLAGTVKDTALGGAVGAAIAPVASLGGKAIEYGGKLAGKGMAKVMGDVASRSASAEGRYAKIQAMGQGARRNLPGDIAAASDPLATAEDRALAREAVKYGQGAKAEAIGNKQKWGPRAAPSRFDMDASHLKEIQKEAWEGAGQLAKTAAVGVAGYHGAKALGINPAIGATLGGAGGGAVFLRQAALSAAKNPAILQKLMKLTPVGQAVARVSAKGSTTPNVVGAITYALRDHPAVKAILDEHEPLPDESKGSMYSRVYPNGRSE